jgi:hypothetical protein
MRPLLAVAAAMLACASVAPATAGGWAVAYSPSKGWLTVYADLSSSSEARKLALGTCSKWAEGCELIGSGWNGCFAFARRGKTGSGWGLGEGERLGLAEAEALRQCKSRASGSCEVEYSRCEF